MPEETNQIVLGAVEVDTGANPSAQGGEDEGVDDHAVKVVDIVDTFHLHVGPIFYSFDLCCPSCSVCLISMLIAHSCRSNLSLTISSLSPSSSSATSRTSLPSWSWRRRRSSRRTLRLPPSTFVASSRTSSCKFHFL